MTRRAVTAACRIVAAAAGLVLVLPAPVQATPVLDAADATELAQALADATDEQDVCYGWRVNVQDDGGGENGADVGSNFGPGVPLDQLRCAKWVELTGSIHYTSESSESEDDSSVSLESNLSNPPTEADLGDIGAGTGGGFFASSPLTGDDNDVVLANMVRALPLLVAERGEAPYVAFETSTEPAAVQGDPTNKPGPDVLRERWPTLVFAIVLILGGMGWIAAKAMGAFDHRDRRPSRH
jgi:hypothetical protein